MAESAKSITGLDRTAAHIALAAIVVGAAVRLWVLTQRGSLWLDEASLALNVLGRDLSGLARPLDWGQAAPVGFLWLEKALTSALGPAEWVFRLLPAVAGIGTLWLAWQAGRRMVQSLSAALAVVVLAFSLLAIRYSAEAKPYASDALVSVALVLMALRVVEKASDIRRWLALGAAGVAGVILSLPSTFVLAAIGIALARDVWRERFAIRALAMACGFAWLATFAILWLLVIGESSGGAYLREYWAPVMLDVHASDFIGQVIRAAASSVGTPLRWTGSVAVAGAAVAAWMVGLVLVARRDWRMAVLLGGPWGVAALASTAGVYPLSDRLAYFVAPLALLAAMEPVGVLLNRVSARLVGMSRVAEGVAWGVAVAAAAWVGMDAMRMLRAPGTLEPTHALFTGVQSSADSTGAGVYVYARAVPAWVYATTDWRSPDRERFNAFLEVAGSTDAPGHENFARSTPVAPGDGEGLVTRATHEYRGTRNGFTALEFAGLAAGVRYRIAGPMSADAPSLGWAQEEARRVSMIVDGSFSGTAWVVASHYFEGSARDELKPLLAAVEALGLRIVEERRGGQNAVALRIVGREQAPPAK